MKNNIAVKPSPKYQTFNSRISHSNQPPDPPDPPVPPELPNSIRRFLIPTNKNTGQTPRKTVPPPSQCTSNLSTNTIKRYFSPVPKPSPSARPTPWPCYPSLPYYATTTSTTCPPRASSPPPMPESVQVNPAKVTQNHHDS